MPDTLETRIKPKKPGTKVPRQPARGEVLRARPVKGTVDYAELIRETIAKFPKILAALAK